MSNETNAVNTQTDNQQKGSNDFLNKILNILMGISLFAMVTFVFINAVLRYCFNSGWPASEELSRFLFVWVSMLGTIVAYKQNKHVGVDLVVSRLRPGPKKVVEIIGFLFIIAIISTVTYGGFKYLFTVYKTPAPATGLPMGIMALALLVCMISILCMTIARLIKCIKTPVKKEGNK